MDTRLLFRDPIFQLNMVLWSLKSSEQYSYQIYPVLKQAGYCLFAINRKLQLPTDGSIRKSLTGLVNSFDPPVPDIWLRHEARDTDLIIELKSRGFGQESSNANQALKLLVATADLSLSTGTSTVNQRPGHLTIITILQDAGGMMDTLDALKMKLDNRQIPSSPASVIGLGNTEGGAWIWESPNPLCLPQPLQGPLSEPVVVSREIESIEELFPLLLVPWIPGSEESCLHSEGLSVLTGRILTCTLSEIGKAKPPVTLNLKANDLLVEATLGIFADWKTQDRQPFLKKAIDIIYDSIQSTTAEAYKGRSGIDINIPSDEIRRMLLQEIDKIDVKDPSRNLEGPAMIQTSLFNDI